MLHFRELRIGNWVYDRFKVPRQVAYLMTDGDKRIGLDLGDGATQKYQEKPIISGDIDMISQIHLDDQWLMAFGFKIASLQGISDVAYMRDSYVVLLRDWYCQRGVHWFQNWWFFKTGEELKKR